MKEYKFTTEEVITLLKAFHLDSVDGRYSKSLLDWCDKWIDYNVYKNIKFDNIDKKLHISDDSFSLWEYGTCWVKSPVTDEITTHKSRRNTENKVVQFYVENEYFKELKEGGYWLDFHKYWWNNFIPTN